MAKPVPITAGIYLGADSSVRIRYPRNMIPIPGQEGVADGHLRPGEGITSFGTGPGADRAGLVWSGTGNDVHYRVMGTKLVTVSSAGVVTAVPSGAGDVGSSGFARMDFGFSLLGVLSGGFLWYWDKTTLAKVTDPNIPASLTDMAWLDSYFIVTDGTNIAVSDIATPTTFNAAKFATTDRPDPVQCLHKVVGKLHVVSRHYIDVFRNAGGSGFPFERVDTAVIPKGAIGRGAACVFNDVLAFVGSGFKEAPSVYLGRNGATERIATTEIDTLLQEYTQTELAAITMDSIFDRGSQLLFVHLPDRSVVYDRIASLKAEQPMWHTRTSGVGDSGQYRARNIVYANGQWIVGDTQPGSAALGVFSKTDMQQYGLPITWDVYTLLLRNAGAGAVMNFIELLAGTGAVAAGTDPMIAASYSQDGGRTFTQNEYIRAGEAGEFMKRLIWYKQGMWQTNRIYKFSGDSGCRMSILSIDPNIDPLRY